MPNNNLEALCELEHQFWSKHMKPGSTDRNLFEEAAAMIAYCLDRLDANYREINDGVPSPYSPGDLLDQFIERRRCEAVRNANTTNGETNA